MRVADKVFRTLAAIAILVGLTYAQQVPPSPPQNTAANAVSGPAGTVSTPSGLTIAVTPGPVYCTGAISYIAPTQFVLMQNQTYNVAFSCLSDQLYVRTGFAIQGADLLLATVVTGATTVGTITDTRNAIMFPLTTDASYVVPLGDCQVTIGAGTFAAAVLTGAGNGAANPGPFRTAAGSTVLQAITTAATSALNLDCDLTPVTKLTTGKGAFINNIQIFYGVQTTALTSITAPTVQSLTYPATGAAAGLTNAAAGGALTVTPTLQLTTTTSGQCFSENIALGTPINAFVDLQRLTVDQIFNQSAAAAQTLQICGVIVHYTNIPL